MSMTRRIWHDATVIRLRMSLRTAGNREAYFWNGQYRQMSAVFPTEGAAVEARTA